MTAPLALCVRRAPVPHQRDCGAEVSVRVPSAIAYVEEAVELLARHCLAGYPTPPRTAFRLRVVLAEALANAIICGNHEDPSKWVWVTVELRPELIHIHIRDEGDGFDPAAVPEPLGREDLDRVCGRGIFLIRHLADHVTFNDRGNIICMTLRRR
ncbi:MAG: ATP-binding protein [Gemmatimonadota bacterium]